MIWIYEKAGIDDKINHLLLFIIQKIKISMKDQVKYLCGFKEFVCHIAGVYYRIKYQYPYIEKLYKDYIVSENVAEDIVKIECTERELNDWCKKYPDVSRDYLEHSCIFSHIIEGLVSHNSLLMHGAAIEYHDRGYIFTAPSGTGKSTHIVQWRKYLGVDVIPINGDKPIITLEDEDIYINGTPFAGKENWQTNKKCPLRGICLLKRGLKNRIKKVEPSAYLEYFLSQVYLGEKKEEIIAVLDLFDKMSKRVSFYVLECDISEEAVKCSFETMTGEKWRENT